MQLRTVRQLKGHVSHRSVQHTAYVAFALLLSVGLASTAKGQQPRRPRVLLPGRMLDGGRIFLSTPELKVDLLRYSGTVAARE